MRKFIATALTFIFVLTSFYQISYSASLQLTRIGALNTEGQMYTEWWYTGINPTFVGTADEGEVVIGIDDAEYTTTADASGNWSYYAELAAGDYDIVISQGSEVISFLLHLGQEMSPSMITYTGETDETTVSVPDTGFNQVVGLTLGLGIVLLGSFLYINNSDLSSKLKFEKKFIKED